ncbi:MAG: zf-HC2 domain-containing protein [Planctomycetes bacterium]|nr:zf-HC2 domain-containing protein [Planctomycetota bacterium]
MASRRMPAAQNTQLDCSAADEMLRPYLEEKLSMADARALEAHLAGCGTCQQLLESRRQLVGFMGTSMASRGLSEDFTEAATMRLARHKQNPSGAAGPNDKTGGVETMGRQAGDDEELLEEEEVVAAPAGGLLDSLQASMGAAPWWIISGAFHALLILLVFLVGMVVMQAKQQDTVIVTNLEKQPEQKEEEKEKVREIFNKPVPVEQQSEIVTDEKPVVTHEVVEFADHDETDDNAESTSEAKGEDGISDAFLGGTGTVSSLGLGGGGRAGAFGRPGPGGKQRLVRARQMGGGKETESAVDKALEWLAKHQEADGHWDSTKYGGKNTDLACSGWALLAFLGAGHTEKVGKYKENVQRAVTWLIAQQDNTGLLKNPGGDQSGVYRGYSHAIAAMGLAEASAMARIGRTKEAAQKAIEYAVDIHLAGEGSEKRGYRYVPKQDPADISNHGWYVMLVKSAKVAGLQIPQGGIEGAIWFLDQVEDKNFAKDANDPYDNGRHRYGYSNPQSVSYRRTAIGILNRQFMGWKAEELQGGVNWFIKSGGVPNKGRIDLYYWYYGTLCTFQQGGDVWKTWNDGLKGTLLPMQRVGGDEDGSWDPTGDYAGYWGRVGQTAISALCLEVYYRYLPMYRE